MTYDFTRLKEHPQNYKRRRFLPRGSCPLCYEKSPGLLYPLDACKTCGKKI
jgi:uncharacterized protein (DUF983 family)